METLRSKNAKSGISIGTISLSALFLATFVSLVPVAYAGSGKGATSVLKADKTSAILATPSSIQDGDDETIYNIVDESAKFGGDKDALQRFLNENLQYPKEAREKGVQGMVYVTFVVEKDGTVSDVKAMKGIGAGCDEEAVRVIKAMPKWTPAKHNGKIVRMQYILPFKFTLPK